MSDSKLKLNDLKTLAEIFKKVAENKKITYPAAEKDFWVVTILDWIFNKSQFKDFFIFKGGTSLSKVYKLINRFSEDIDLVLNYEKIDPTSKPLSDKATAGEKTRYKDKCTKDLKIFLINDFNPKLSKYLKDQTGKAWNIEIIEYKNNIQLRLAYPKTSSAPSTIKEYILIECNAFSDHRMQERHEIKSYVAEVYPHIFSNKQIFVNTISWLRTFWEKVTILHSKSFADEINEGYARHYYDVYCIATHKDKSKNILDNLDELLKVAEFKMKYYHSASSKYEIIKDGKLSLIPKEDIKNRLKKFYIFTKGLYQEPIISFDDIIDYLKTLQTELNNAIKKMK